MDMVTGKSSVVSSPPGKAAGVVQRKLMVDELKALLNHGYAHATFEDAVKDVPSRFRGKTHGGLPYSIWQLAEHIRITQRDILEFSRNSAYESPVWPDDYWPADPQPPDEAAWKKMVKTVVNDRQAFIDLLENPENELDAPFPHGDGQNLIREALLIADHTAYHVGQIILMRKILKIW